MPKLDGKTAKRVQTGADNADSTGFALVPESIYRLRLRSVTVKETGNNGKEPKLHGCPMWVWEFEIPEGAQYAGRRFWTQRILPADNGYEHADFMMAKFAEPFEALGGSASDDTDTLIGLFCRGLVTERIIEKGPKTGEKTNSLDDLMPDGEVDGSSPLGASDDDYDPDDVSGFSDDPPF